ncbi:BTAD domain-containing putative transcriptional regulator [Leptolyngbya sp. 7M]|uniref:AfsR/SARP family transcriptional regulator n=1 Tax=Leptolyngbya sp. 7M TaxID=2812896 RepID=UPI001B8BD90C|nr:BTAD domain-containing putative transcriptional regulator [Leptolyngbya sp. 7M]QYO62499.1 hypothetical protein JVX88_20770 [Leptolyngbya sp. 7M]
MTRLRLGLLGPMQVTLNQQPIVTFPYEKVRALLAYLATESNHPHHRDRLATLLWADQCESKARSNLRKALSMLRQMLEDIADHSPLFLTTRNTIQFNPVADHSLDVTIFTQLIDRYLHHSQPASDLCPESVSGLEQAVALYRGPFLEQVHLPDNETFEIWAALTRQRLHDLVINIYVKLVTYYEQQQEYHKAQQHVQRQLQLEPWNEVAHRCLMRILTQRGRRTEALQQYDRCCKLLKQELATEPEPATITLWEAIRSDEYRTKVCQSLSKVN